jgi:hypothetical protein
MQQAALDLPHSAVCRRVRVRLALRPFRRELGVEPNGCSRQVLLAVTVRRGDSLLAESRI